MEALINTVHCERLTPLRGAESEKNNASFRRRPESISLVKPPGFRPAPE